MIQENHSRPDRLRKILCDNRHQIVYGAVLIFWILASIAISFADLKGIYKAVMIIAMEIAALFVLSNWKALVTKRVLKQLIVIWSMVTAFFLSALLSEVTDKTKWVLVGYKSLFVFLLYAWLIFQYFRCLKQEGITCIGFLSGVWKRLVKAVSDNKLFSIVLIVSIILRVISMTTFQRWDAGEYYNRFGNACEEFDFSFDKYFFGFTLVGHPTLAFASLSAIGEFLYPRGVAGVLSVNLVCTLAMLVCLYSLLKKHLAKMPKNIAALITLVVSCVPLFLGAFPYFQPDYYLIIFLIYIVYTEYEKQYILLAFWEFALLQTKEVGLVVLAGYIGLRLIYSFATAKKGLKNRFGRILKDPVNWITLIPLAFYALYIYINGGISRWMTVEDATSSTASLNYFGFDTTFFIERLKQFFVMNFAWIFLLMLLITVIYYFVQRRRQSDRLVAMEAQTFGLLGALIAFGIFESVFITVGLYRYLVLFAVILALFACIGIAAVFKKRPAGAYILLIVTAALMAGQSFITADPVSNAIIETVDTKGNKMLYSSENSNYYGDCLVYNRQYSWLDTEINKILSKVGYDSETQVIVADKVSLAMEIDGWRNKKSSSYDVYWDAENNKRTTRKNKNYDKVTAQRTDDIFPAIGLPLKEAEQFAADELSPKAVAIFVPYYEIDESAVMKKLSKYYYVGERQVTQCLYGELAYYQLIRKTAPESLLTLADGSHGNRPENIIKENADYKTDGGVRVTWGDRSLPKEAVSEYIGKTAFRRAETNSVIDQSRPIRENDSISVSYSSYVDGALYNEGIAALDVVPDQYMDGFADMFIGKKVGETFTFEWTVPEDYPTDPSVQGKTIRYMGVVCRINSGRTVPQRDDALARAAGDVDTYEEYEANVEQQLTTEYSEKYDDLVSLTAIYDEVGVLSVQQYKDILLRFKDEWDAYCRSSKLDSARMGEIYKTDDFLAEMTDVACRQYIAGLILEKKLAAHNGDAGEKAYEDYQDESQELADLLSDEALKYMLSGLTASEIKETFQGIWNA